MDDAALEQWLALREAADAASRSANLTRAVSEAVSRHRVVRVLDLATGAGSNIRYLIPHLGMQQRWMAVDRSPLLLERLVERMSEWAMEGGYTVVREPTRCVITGAALECHVDTRAMDLGALDDDAVFAGRHLVTASALLDLVSESWLRSLAAHSRTAGAATLFTITYNGQSISSPAEPEDTMVLDLFNRHQRTDKGLGGPAAGPSAADAAARAFETVGYRVMRESSDWQIPPSLREMQRQLIVGWASAAAEMEPSAADVIERWRARRLARVDAGQSRLVVGHEDIAALI